MLCSQLFKQFVFSLYSHNVRKTLFFSFFNAENGYLGLQSYKNKTCKFDFTSLLLISFGNQYKKLERFELLTKFECQKSRHKQDTSNIKSLLFLYFINIWYVDRICAIKKEHASFGYIIYAIIDKYYDFQKKNSMDQLGKKISYVSRLDGQKVLQLLNPTFRLGKLL